MHVKITHGKGKDNGGNILMRTRQEDQREGLTRARFPPLFWGRRLEEMDGMVKGKDKIEKVNL